MISTKEKSVVGTQKIMLTESKHTTTKGHQITNEPCKRGHRNKASNQKNKIENKKIAILSLNIYIITLNINGLNYPIKRQRMAKWIKKQNPTICIQKVTLVLSPHRLRVKG